MTTITDQDLAITGVWRPHNERENSIVVSSNELAHLMDHDVNWQNLRDCACRWLTNQDGFDRASLRFYKEDDDEYEVTVQFINDGIVMAKLQGYID